MRKLLLAIVVLTATTIGPVITEAGIQVRINIPLPPLIVFAAPPELVVLPETYIYVDPDLDMDIFFYNGWWWRPWDGRWYRSRYYDRGWTYRRGVPAFYGQIPSGWRDDYREHRWRGHQWDYQRIPHQRVQRDWRRWKRDRYWEKRQTWGVEGLRRGPRSQEPSQSQRVQPRQSRPEGRMVKPEGRTMEQRQDARPPSRDRSRSQQRENVGPPPREAPGQQHHEASPRSSDDEQRRQEAGPKSKGGKHQSSKEQQADPERGNRDRRDRK